MKMSHGMLALVPALLLAGCGDSDVREVRSWMDQVKSETKPKVKPLPASKEFIPFAYDQGGAVDPFSPAKMAEAGLLAQARSALQPDMNRPREALEAYPLDTMTMHDAEGRRQLCAAAHRQHHLPRARRPAPGPELRPGDARDAGGSGNQGNGTGR